MMVVILCCYANIKWLLLAVIHLAAPLALQWHWYYVVEELFKVSFAFCLHIIEMCKIHKLTEGSVSYVIKSRWYISLFLIDRQSVNNRVPGTAHALL